MEKIRIGNDFTVEWGIIRKLNGESSEYNLEGRNLVLKCVSPYTTIEVKDFSVEGNVIKWPFYGKDQKVTGIYSLILEENKGEYGMVTIDVISAFMLVPHTKDEQRSSNSALAIEKIELTSEVVIGVGASVTVDSELSESSENPVQNMVVTTALNALGEALELVNENLGKKADAEVVESLTEGINSLQDNKVDKEEGKGLSTNDFTTDEKNKLSALKNYDESGMAKRVTKLESGKQDKRTFVTLDNAISGNIDLNAETTYYLMSTSYEAKTFRVMISASESSLGKTTRIIFYVGGSSNFVFPESIIWNRTPEFASNKFYDVTLEFAIMGGSPMLFGTIVEFGG